MEGLSSTMLPAGYSYGWTGTALQEKEAAGKTAIILGLAVLFAYLFLVGLYESWTIPVPVLLSVTVGILGAMATLWPETFTLTTHGAMRATTAALHRRGSNASFAIGA
jgi:hydrophobic/amphiphilic exporter-1 (mainly G- bacteria), HAE1 family